jgi:DNA-binding transcriptional LysR family regulator
MRRPLHAQGHPGATQHATDTVPELAMGFGTQLLRACAGDGLDRGAVAGIEKVKWGGAVHGGSWMQWFGGITLGIERHRGNGASLKAVLQRVQGRSSGRRRCRQSHTRIAGMDDLAFDDLKLFARVAALGTLSAVARERDVPVSQVSRALARIEKSCGARLVHRSTHALALTAEGETFLDYCRQLTHTMESLEGAFASQAREASGLVRVAASTVIAQYLLLPSLPGLAERHPKLRVELEVSDRLADMAREGIDIAIRTATSLNDNVIARQIGELGRGLYASPEYAAQFGLPAHPDELHRHRLIANTAAPQLNHWPFVVGGQPMKRPIEGEWRTNDTGLAANMVLQGLGIGRLATLVGEPLVRQQRLVPVLADFSDPQQVPIYAVLAGARQRLPKIRACVDYFAEWVGSRS